MNDSALSCLGTESREERCGSAGISLRLIAIATALFACVSVAISVPDRRNDAEYLDTQIKHISDADLFAAIDLDRAGLEKVKKAVEVNDYDAAYRAWAAYWNAKNKVTLVRHGSNLEPLSEVIARIRSDPEKVAAVVEKAEPLMRHEITGWGNVTHQHGDVIDFNYFYGRSGQYGFHYWHWSLRLLFAYYATDDDKYLRKFDLFFNQWYEQRDNVHGRISNLDVIWYELGLGLRNSCFLQYYTCQWEDRSVQTDERVLKTVLGAARWLYELERQNYRGGNWQITGSYGLVEIGVRLQEFKEAREWIETGVARLAEHLERDFYADGCHSERTPGSYMVIAYREPHILMTLLRAGDIESDAAKKFVSRLEKPLEWWMLATTPLGGLPALNDAGSRGLPVGMLLEGSRVYGRDDFRYIVEHLSGGEETDAEPPTTTSVNLEPSGVAVMRTGWQRDDAYLFLDYGTTGGAHTHQATLHFELYAHGSPLALDAGIGRTYDDPLHRSWYRTAKAHNMLTVDDANIDKASARGRDTTWYSDARIDFFSATHDGYKASHGVVHTRTVVFLKPDVFIIRDVCGAEQDGQRLSWYFHSPTDLVIADDQKVRSHDAPGVLLIDAEPETLAGIREGKGVCSLSNLGGYREIDWTSYDRLTSIGTSNEFTIAVMPFTNETADAQFSRLPTDRPEVSAYRLDREGCTDVIVFGDGSPVNVDGSLTTDGAFAWTRSERGEEWKGLQLGGSFLRVDGTNAAAFVQ